MRHLTEEPEEIIQRLSIPCLLIAGHRDPLLDPQALQELSGGCEFQVLDGGHLDLPALSAPTIANWVRKHRAL